MLRFAKLKKNVTLPEDIKINTILLNQHSIVH